MQSSTRKERTQFRQRQILDAAVAAFAEKGFYKTRVSEIARRAGVADGTIYLYFKSKDDILISLFEVRMEEVLKVIHDALLDCTDAEQRIHEFFRLYMSIIDRDPALAEVITIELRQSDKFIREYENPKFKELLRYLASIIGDGQRQGVFRSEVDPRLTARAIFGALDELTLAGLFAKRPIESSRVARSLSDLFVQGLS